MYIGLFENHHVRVWYASKKLHVVVVVKVAGDQGISQANQGKT